ncbi:hypothetical protein N9Q52_01655 [Polaribacter sp.]|jgi:hypothetical protein|nr:hypothetical protein [Polaribacter sp.]
MSEKTLETQSEVSPNKEQLSTDERINNFSEGGVKAIFISIILIILSAILIYNSAEILNVGSRISRTEAKQMLFFSVITSAVCHGSIIVIWVKLFKNLSNKV